MPERIWAERLEGWIAWNNGEFERVVRETAPAILHERPSAAAPSIAFHVWHTARWIDRHAEAVTGWRGAPAAEIWIAGDFAARWGLTGTELGDYGGTGAGLGDDASAALRLPDAEGLLEYLAEAARSLEQAVAAIPDDATLEQVAVDLYGDENPLGEVLLNHLSHADRHLGMVEALRGVLGERGTITV